MKNRYQIIMDYDDQTCITEYADNAIIILETLNLLLDDSHVVAANVYDRLEYRNIFSWAR